MIMPKTMVHGTFKFPSKGAESGDYLNRIVDGYLPVINVYEDNGLFVEVDFTETDDSPSMVEQRLEAILAKPLPKTEDKPCVAGM